MRVSTEAKPVLMSTPMVLALSGGLKTQTRRTTGLEEVPTNPDVRFAGLVYRDGVWFASFYPKADGAPLPRCPYGGPGGQLWVRESIQRDPGGDPETGGQTDSAVYVADGASTPIRSWGWKQKKLPGIHMPKSCCRFILNLKEVRVERLHALTEADAIAEGMVKVTGLGTTKWQWPTATDFFPTASEAYRRGWLWLNGEASWNLNPWVFVLSFTVTKA